MLFCLIFTQGQVTKSLTNLPLDTMKTDTVANSMKIENQRLRCNCCGPGGQGQICPNGGKKLKTIKLKEFIVADRIETMNMEQIKKTKQNQKQKTS